MVVNNDNEGARSVAYGLDAFTFGLKPGAECTAVHLNQDEAGRPVFDVTVHGEFYAHVQLHVWGEHNVLNALAAASAAYVLGLPGKAVEEGLAAFTGAGRRFEHKGTYNGAEIYDDYAHHPAELRALLEMAKTLGYRRVICAFQPHTYTRTKALFDDFVRELQLADVAVLTDIYAAREQNTVGISSKDLVERIPGSVYCPSLEDAAAALRRIAGPGDLVLTVGAGDIFTVGKMLVKA